ncbi:hypothetical protein KIH74_14975 [Kineosporia sp. J2-2]|uniref:Uncharacterized protein n=1 Tax=Kineosporia corallincola TaxID=2835133 RepID=A0ABS5TGM5_9ACTN|nr:hypothetical protein [Kineosporia corallincola]MBT0770242.1 hypothetical protein [Kineosporia corallincola]
MNLDDFRGIPAEDEERLREWLDHVPEGVSWLQQQSGVDLDRSVESLRPLWSWAIDHLSGADGGVGDSKRDFPPWARWRPYRRRAEAMRPDRMWLWGAVVAYFGEVFIARAAAPEVEWRVLRHPVETMQDQGQFVLLRPAHINRRKPRNWVCPHVILGNTIGQQDAEPDPNRPLPTGYNDPGRLQTLLFMQLQAFGDVVPELAPPEPEPGLDPADTLLGKLYSPEVAAARAACPSRWVGLPEGLDDDDLTFTTEEVCAEVGFGPGEEGEWSLFLHDGIRPVVDVEVRDEDDPLLRTLLSHPLVVQAEHSDRELYEWSTVGAPSEGEMAALVLRGLAAAQERALRLALAQRDGGTT